MKMRIWPGRPYPLGCDLGRQRHQLRPLFGACDRRRAVPVRFGRQRKGIAAHRAGRADRHGLARLSARRAAGPDLRLSRRWSLRAGRGTSLQSAQGAARSLCQGDRPRNALVRRDVGLQSRRSRRPILSFDDRDNAKYRAAGRRARRGLHLGRRSAAADALEQDDDLRGARQGLHQAASRSAREAARHLRRPQLRRGDPLSEEPGRHGRRAAAGARARRRSAPGRTGPGELLGLQHAGLLRAERRYALGRGGRRRGPRVQDDGPQPARAPASR